MSRGWTYSVSTSSQTTAQQHQEINRWSPNTSSIATSTAGDFARGAPGEQRAVGASRADEMNDVGGLATSNTASDATSNRSIEAARERTLSTLEHGGRPVPASERAPETLVSAIPENSQAAQQMSSSGTGAQRRREPRRT
ncbi:hypothetical protein FQN51_008590 [Onygenales sp. PD_10]|nr:hypothetical protein FQN51_008590 [Onygenales sp. PD_10]